MKYQKRPTFRYFGRLRTTIECEDWYKIINGIRECRIAKHIPVDPEQSLSMARRAIFNLKRNRTTIKEKVL